jgi:hypothetical protein
VTGWQKFGCTAYVIAAVVLIPMLFLMSIFGQCGAWAPASCEPMTGFEQFMWFPGSAILIVAGGIAMLKFFKRKTN